MIEERESCYGTPFFISDDQTVYEFVFDYSETFESIKKTNSLVETSPIKTILAELKTQVEIDRCL